MRRERGGRGGGGGLSFSPVRLSGCVLWVRADLGITLNGSNVSAWADQSGNGNHLIQGNAALQPLYVASGGPNNQAYVDHDTADYLNDAFTLVQPEHIFLVVRKGVPTANNPTLIDGGGGVGNRMRLYYSGVAPGSNTNLSMTSDGAATIISPTHVATSWNRVEAQFNSTAGKVRINDTAYVIGNVAANAGDGLRLSEFGATGAACAADFAEVILFNRILVAAEILAIHDYLRKRYEV